MVCVLQYWRIVSYIKIPKGDAMTVLQVSDVAHMSPVLLIVLIKIFKETCPFHNQWYQLNNLSHYSTLCLIQQVMQ